MRVANVLPSRSSRPRGAAVLVCLAVLLVTTLDTTTASRIPSDSSLCEILEGSWQVHVHPDTVVANVTVSLQDADATDSTQGRTWNISTLPHSDFAFNALVDEDACRSDEEDANSAITAQFDTISRLQDDGELVPREMKRVQLRDSVSWKGSRVASGTFEDCNVLLTVLSRSVFQLVWMCPGELIHSALGQRTSRPPDGERTADGSSSYSWNEFWSGKQPQFWLLAGGLGVLQLIKWRKRMNAIDRKHSSGRGTVNGETGKAMKQRILQRAVKRRSAAAEAAPKGSNAKSKDI
jgi:hypothetical protein